MSRDSYWRQYTGVGSVAARVRAEHREELRAAREAAREGRWEAESEEDSMHLAKASENIVGMLWIDYQNGENGGTPGDILCEYALSDEEAPRGRQRRIDIAGRALKELCGISVVVQAGDDTYCLAPWFAGLLQVCGRLDRRSLDSAFGIALAVVPAGSKMASTVVSEETRASSDLAANEVPAADLADDIPF